MFQDLLKYYIHCFIEGTDPPADRQDDIQVQFTWQMHPKLIMLIT